MSYFIDKERLAWKQVKSETVVLDLAEATYFTLNDVGSIIWGVLVEGGNLDDASHRVFQGFEVDLESAREDTKQYIDLLLSERLLSALPRNKDSQ